MPYELTWGLRIPLRDGAHLNATHYKPKGFTPDSDPLPAIFTLTPYISDTYHQRGRYFAQNGYHYLIVDVRGRGSSEGTFRPMEDESENGYDITEWIAAQPWCDGQIAMWGGSYAGFNQWATAKAFPPHLVTIVPVASVHPGLDFPAYRGVFYRYNMRWRTFTSGLTGNPNLFGDEAFWNDRYYEHRVNHIPFSQLDSFVGNPNPDFQRWISAPPNFWADKVPTAEDYRRFEIPILSITGHYDGDQPGALHYYRQHMQHGSPKATANHYLILGPWDHAGTRTPNRHIGGLDLGEASLLDMNDLHKAWYDWVMKDGSRPEFLKGRVALYVLGANEWVYAERLEELSTGQRTYYLSGPGHSVFHAGDLVAEPPGDEEPSTYVYDPLDLRRAEADKAAGDENETYLVTQRVALAIDGDGLIFHSAPFEEDTVLVGQFALTMWAMLDVPDTDFATEVHLVKRDGSAVQLTSTAERARWRNALTEPTPVPEGEIVRYTLDHYFYTAWQAPAGSRLRLVIRGLGGINFQTNYNTGGDVSHERAEDSRTATVTIYHDSEHPSHLTVRVR